jgi:hypothetical protein
LGLCAARPDKLHPYCRQRTVDARFRGLRRGRNV